MENLDLMENSDLMGNLTFYDAWELLKNGITSLFSMENSIFNDAYSWNQTKNYITSWFSMENSTVNETSSWLSMENSTINETISWSGNASVTSSENVLSHILRFIITPSERKESIELSILIKYALTCLFIRKIAKRSQPLTLQHDLLLLVICFFTLASKTVDVCTLSFMWSFHKIISEEGVLFPFMVLYVVMFFLFTLAPSYYALLIFVVNVLFISTSCRLILGGSSLCITGFFHFLVVACGYAGCFDALYNTAGPNMDDTNVILMMFVPMIAISLHPERPFIRALIVTSVIFYCMYLKIKVYDVTELDSNSSNLDEWIPPSERHRLQQFQSMLLEMVSGLLKLCSIDHILDYGTFLEKVFYYFR